MSDYRLRARSATPGDYNFIAGRLAFLPAAASVRSGVGLGDGTTGTLPTQTLSAANDTVAAGYYEATTLSAVDADLAAGNIVTGKTIFGFAGSASGGGGASGRIPSISSL